MKYRRFTARLAVLLLFLNLALAHQVYADKTAYTARFHYRHEPSGILLQSAKITVSPKGLRIEQMPDGRGDARREGSANVFLANFETHRFWFLDRHRHLVHAIPVQLKESSKVSARAVDEAMFDDGSVLSLPCGGEPDKARYLEDSFYRGRWVERWHCESTDREDETHWYAPDIGLVVRTESADGFVGMLTDILSIDARNLVFSPPSHYRSVGIEEFINPKMPIASYSAR